MDKIKINAKSDYHFDFVNFTDESNINTNTNISNSNNLNNYDDITTEHYRMMRLYKIDPIMKEQIPTQLIFEFNDKWNPLNGERIGIDEIGPLYFNALNLYEYYFKNRYNGLWNIPAENFQGYYGDLVGSGHNIKIKSRGYNPEKYLYRLPIIDCYLQKTHNHATITMGPKLTDLEIDQIDKIIKLYKTHNVTLKELKLNYDNAINDNPNIFSLKNQYPNFTDIELHQKYNRMFVDQLVNFY